jgi:hypothetical protein
MPTTTTKIQSSITVATPTGSSGFNGYVVDTGNTPATLDQFFAAGSSAVAFTMAFAFASLQSFWLLANQNCTITLFNGATLENTINLVAGVPYFWSLSSGLANPFAANITTAKMTCTPSTRLQAAALQT